MTEESATQGMIAIVGGTGPQGSGLAFRFARAGYRVVLGSRSLERAEAKAAELTERGAAHVTAATNAEACARASLVVMAVPYDGHDQLVQELSPHLSGRIVVTCVNPLTFDRRGPIGLLSGDSSAAEIAASLLPESTVVGSFQHLSAVALNDPEADLSGQTVMIATDDEDAADQVAELARAVTGTLGVRIGPLRLNRHLEPLTAALISVNRRYRTHSGIALTGVPDGPPVRR